MTLPYGVISDPHYHRWDAFATTNADGLNSRLEIQLDATKEAAKAMKAAGCKHMLVAGDICANSTRSVSAGTRSRGNFDESAQVFIDHLARRWSQQWRDLEKRANEFDRFMDAMDTAKEALAAGTPLDLESLFKGEMASAMFATMFAGEFVRSGARN